MKKIEKLTIVEAYLLEKGLGLDSFYCVTAYDDEIKLQGRYSSSLVTRLGFDFRVNEGFICASYRLGNGSDAEDMGNFVSIEVTLTE